MTTITTKLNGTEKQVAWAQDIRERAVASIEYEFEQAKAEAEEARVRYADNPKRARTITRKAELAEKAEREGAIIIAALGDVEDARFFINNRDKLGSIKNAKVNLTIDGYLDYDMNRLRPIATTEPETETTTDETATVNVTVKGSTEAIDAWITEATKVGEQLGLDILISAIEATTC